MKKQVKIAIMGLGTVGGGTYDILVGNHDLIERTQGVDIKVAKILDKRVDALVARGISRDIITTDINDIINDKSIDIVVEVMGGVEPAKSFILSVLKSGKSVVTANKELIAKHWAEIEAIAKENNSGFYFEASCVGGVPVIRTLTESIQGDKIQEIMGIINGTTNYILSKMTEENMSYDAALAEAQSLGFAEANPSADVDGFDAMYKLSILSSLAFHTCIPYKVVYREGISKVTRQDIASGKELGYTLKLLAIGSRYGNTVEVRVHPTFVPNEHPLAAVRGSFNAFFLKGDYVDDIMLYGRGAGAKPTGSAIVSDIVFCARAKEHRYNDFENSGNVSSEISINSDFVSKYYLALSVVDKPGVLAKITAIFGQNLVSLRTVIQRDGKGDSASIIFMTHEINEYAIQEAIKGICKISDVKSLDSLIRVI